MIPIYFSAIFGSLFVPKLMTGLVAADLGVKIGMSLYFKDLLIIIKNLTLKYTISNLMSYIYYQIF